MQIQVLTLITLIGIVPGISSDSIKAQEYDRTIRRYDDPVTNQTLFAVRLHCTSEERMMSGYRLSMEFDLIKSVIDQKQDYQLRCVLRNNPEEWPLADVAYMIIDGQTFQIALASINPRNTAAISGSALDGNVSISTSETQLLRMEADLQSDVLKSIDPASEIMFVFHSGAFPLTFKLDRNEVNEIWRLRNAQLN